MNIKAEYHSLAVKYGVYESEQSEMVSFDKHWNISSIVRFFFAPVVI